MIDPSITFTSIKSNKRIWEGWVLERIHYFTDKNYPCHRQYDFEEMMHYILREALLECDFKQIAIDTYKLEEIVINVSCLNAIKVNVNEEHKICGMKNLWVTIRSLYRECTPLLN